MIPKEFREFETERTLIRETLEPDCAPFAVWERDPDVTEFFTMNKDRSYDDIAGELALEKEDPTCQYFTIVLKESGEPAGRVMLSRIDRHYDSLDITRIYIGPVNLRGRGLGREVLERILAYAFLDLGMERVTIDHFPANKRADHLYLKLGFTDEGILRSAGKKDGVYVDLQLKSMLRKEYEKKYLSSAEGL